MACAAQSSIRRSRRAHWRSHCGRTRFVQRSGHVAVAAASALLEAFQGERSGVRRSGGTEARAHS